MEVRGVAAVPTPSGQNDAARGAAMVGVPGGGACVRGAGVPVARVLHRVVRSRHLHTQPSDRVPFPSGRSRDSRCRWPHPPHLRFR